MKPLFFLSFAVLFITGCKKSAGTGNNSARGNVLRKTVRTDPYFDTLTTMYYFNSKGLDSAHVMTNALSSGAIQISKLLFEYNEQGKMTKMTEISTSGTVAAVYTFDRDAKGRMVRTKVSPAGAKYTYSFAYNDEDQVISDTTYDMGDGRLISCRAYGYDNNGNQAQEEVFSAQGHPLVSIGQFNWSYDEKINPYNYQGFREMLLATDWTQALGPHNAVGQFTLTGQTANIPLDYGYYDEGLVKFSTDKSTYNIVYYYH